ncbi:GAF domain-containing protein [Cystobacter fuscus]
MGEAYKFIEDVLAAKQLVATRGDTGSESVAALDLWQVSYRFLHDRVQQAAYSLIPEGKRPGVHLMIGQLMLSALEPEARDEKLFAIVGHLNRGAPLLGGQQERDDLAELNLAAGHKAKVSAAQVAAREYLLTGIALLGGDGWRRCYELALKLHTQVAESCLLSGDVAGMEYHIAQVLAHAREPLEKIQVYEIKCSWLRVNQKIKESVESGLELLSQLGIDFPRTVTPEHIAAASAELTAALGGRSIEEIAFLPPMTEPRLLAAMQVLNRINMSAHSLDKSLFVVTMLRRITLALKHGNEGSVAYSYISYSAVLTAQGEFDAAYAFGRLSLHILEQYNARKYAARVLFMWNMFPRAFKGSLRECLRGFQETYPIALEVGDIETAGWLITCLVITPFLLGHPLEEVDASATRWTGVLLQMNLESARHQVSLVHRAVQNLRGFSEEPCRLVGAVYDEVEMAHLEAKTGDSVITAMALLNRLMLCGFMGRYDEAAQLAAMPEIQMATLAGSSFLLLYHFFGALAHLALQPAGCSPEERERARERVSINLATVKVWAENAPMNHAARYTLLLAEQSRVEGETEKARARFYCAMALAQEHQLPHDEALATERFASFLRGLEEHEAARFFMAKARHLYQVWGAEAKVRELDRAFPDLRPLALALSGSPLTSSSLTHNSSLGHTSSESKSTRGLHSLDLLSILKASQAISEEMVLKDLMEKLLRIVVENAGARWGLLMLEGERSLVAVAKRSEAAEELSITLHESPAQAPVEFSQSIVRYVERTQEVMVLGDASSDHSLRSDPYIAARKPRSVLCMPILYQKKQAGILYLENELLANAFTPERCNVLELLVAQAAISLENARLYDTLEMKVKARTHELSEALQRLRETQKQLILQEKLASLGSLTSGIAHEIRNPLNFVNNFSQLTVSLVSELREELEHQRQQPQKARPEVVEQLLGDVAQSAEKPGSTARGRIGSSGPCWSTRGPFPGWAGR